jgi:hypothetical protein
MALLKMVSRDEQHTQGRLICFPDATVSQTAYLAFLLLIHLLSECLNFFTLVYCLKRFLLFIYTLRFQLIEHGST